MLPAHGQTPHVFSCCEDNYVALAMGKPVAAAARAATAATQQGDCSKEGAATRPAAAASTATAAEREAGRQGMAPHSHYQNSCITPFARSWTSLFQEEAALCLLQSQEATPMSRLCMT